MARTDVTLENTTDAANATEAIASVRVKAAELALDLETRKAIARLRKLLPVNPGKVHLFTRGLAGDRWLSDRYVMVKVTDDAALRVHEGAVYSDGSELSYEEFPDGSYKLTAGKGLQPSELAVPVTVALLNLIESKDGNWHRLYRTQWAVSDSEAKLMLAYTKVDGAVQPHAINEGIWTAFEAAFPDDEVLFMAREGDPYKVVLAKDGHPETVAYVARGNFVDPDVKAQAWAVAGAVGAPIIPWNEAEEVAACLSTSP